MFLWRSGLIGALVRWTNRWRDPTDLAFIRRFLDSETANSYDPKVAYPEEEASERTCTGDADTGKRGRVRVTPASIVYHFWKQARPGVIIS